MVDEGLTSYETERELGRGKRKKRPPTIYTDNDEDSDVPKSSKKRQQLLSDDSDSDSDHHKKIRKFSKSEKIQDIPAPPLLSFQDTIDSMRTNQNDRNRKIIVTMEQKNTEAALLLVNKIGSQQTERQELLRKMKEECSTNAPKRSLTISQPNICTKSPLQQVNAALYQSNVYSTDNEEEIVIDEPEAGVEFSFKIPSERHQILPRGQRQET